MDDIHNKVPTDLVADHPRGAQLTRWRRPLDTRWDRVSAWTNMMMVDHGYFRLISLNLHPVGKRAWRSAQPMPHQIRRFAQMGGRTVVSLRGGQTFGSLPLEIEACQKAGLRFENFVMRSRSLPSRESLCDLDAFLQRLEYPVLFHCKSGADRAGMMSTLYLILQEDRPVAEARKQLSLRFGHIRQSKTGILDALFDAYQAEAEGRLTFREWARELYDPQAITARFKATSWGSMLGDKLLARE